MSANALTRASVRIGRQTESRILLFGAESYLDEHKQLVKGNQYLQSEIDERGGCSREQEQTRYREFQKKLRHLEKQTELVGLRYLRSTVALPSGERQKEWPWSVVSQSQLRFLFCVLRKAVDELLLQKDSKRETLLVGSSGGAEQDTGGEGGVVDDNFLSPTAEEPALRFEFLNWPWKLYGEWQRQVDLAKRMRLPRPTIEQTAKEYAPRFLMDEVVLSQVDSEYFVLQKCRHCLLDFVNARLKDSSKTAAPAAKTSTGIYVHDRK